MEENRNYTIEDVLKITVDMLSRIKVPVGLIEEIAMPIDSAKNNLIECINAMNKSAEEEDVHNG